MRHFLAAIALLGLAATPAPGQEPSLHYRFAALGGADGLGSDAPHLFGGVEGAVVGDRWGGAGLLELGNSAEFFSFLLTGGPAVRILRRERIDALLFGGPGAYGEIVPSGARRWSRVTALGASARVPIGPVLVAANLTTWRGRYRGEGFGGSIDVDGTRLAIGFGWGW